MAIEPTIESALTAQRSNLLNKIGNSAQASEKRSVRKTVDTFSDQAHKTLHQGDKKTDSKPVDTRRGRTLNVSV